MRSIKINKVEIVEIEVLQSELLNFITQKNATLLREKHSNDVFDLILVIDVAQKLFVAFRSKIERANKAIANITFAPNEAVVLLKVCNDRSTARSQYESFVMHKFMTLIHQEVINLI